MILGIWDGHDAGAAIIDDKKILCAVNEERFTRRKLEIGFPWHSIRVCLDIAGLKPNDISHVAFSTSDVAKTFTRYATGAGRSYYMFRRKLSSQKFADYRRCFKYGFTAIKGNWISKKLSHDVIKKQLKRMGFDRYKLFLVDHHQAHAASVLTSGFKKALSITLDGVGDAVSSSTNIFNILENNEIQTLHRSTAFNSLGTFFEQVTNLLGFRELEDEGKVMALADYSKFSKSNHESVGHENEKKHDNPLDKFFKVKQLGIKAKYNPIAQYYMLKKFRNSTKPEDFAFFAQQMLENKMLALFVNAINETGIKDIAWSGGVASNIRCNQIIRNKSGLKDWFIFPHMGDGGLALGAAMMVASQEFGSRGYKLEDVYLGRQYSYDEILESAKNAKASNKRIVYEECSSPESLAAELVLDGEMVLWHQGRSEYGPRALGNRSILAPSWKKGIRDELNKRIKRRDHFQPFCPTILDLDAKKMLSDRSGRDDRFMTMGYSMVRSKSVRKALKEVTSIGYSVRPQILGQDNALYRRILLEIRRKTGFGVVLNTSFNIHGEPLVETPRDAIETMIRSGVKNLFIKNFHVRIV